MEEVAREIRKVVPKLRAILHILGVKYYFDPLALWKILAKKNKTTSIDTIGLMKYKS